MLLVQGRPVRLRRQSDWRAKMLGWRGPWRLGPAVQIPEHWCCLLPIVLGNVSCPYCLPLL